MGSTRHTPTPRRTVKARFWVTAVTQRTVAKGLMNREVVLAPVTRATDDNVDWSKFTPSGEIRLVVTADEAGEWFQAGLGEDIIVTFTKPADDTDY